eukprot:2154395-Heterocapsa_arctica.AAC.1
MTHGRGCTNNAEVWTSKFHAIDVITIYVESEIGWMTTWEELALILEGFTYWGDVHYCCVNCRSSSGAEPSEFYCTKRAEYN